MEARYIVHSTYSEEEFIRFNRTVLYKNGRFLRTIILMNVSLVVIGVTALFHIKDYVALVPIAILLGFVNWYLFKGIDMRAARNFKQNAMANGQEFELAFYDDHYEGTSADGTTGIPYSSLSKIIETETNFYIMHGPATGTILQKKGCPDGFVDFIHRIKSRHNL